MPGELGRKMVLDFAGDADFAHGVKVLRHQDHGHDVLRGRAFDGGFEFLDRCLQAFDDGLTLAGGAFALQRLRLGFCFGLLHLEDFVGFATGLRRDLLALRGVDVVHGGFYFGVGNDVSDQRAQNVVAEGVHHFVEIFFDGAGDLLHLLEGFVEGERGHVAEDGVEDVALDLALRIR